MTPPDVGLFVDPATHHFEGDRLFGDPKARDDVAAPYAHLRSWLRDHGIPTHTADRIDDPDVRCERSVYISLGIRHRWPELVDRSDVTLSAFFALECPVVEPKLYLDLSRLAPAFRRLYSFSDGDSLRPFLNEPLEFHPFRIPQSFQTVHQGLWDRTDRRLLTMINANKLPRVYLHELYTERLRAIEYFSNEDGFDLYGKGWDLPTVRVGASWMPYIARRATRALKTQWEHFHTNRQLAAARRVWRGAIPNKAEILSRYKFAICFENMVLPGWITEKLFDCLFSGTVPVYLGAPEIADVVPSDCFVDMRKFDDYPSLAAHLRSMTDAEREAMREAGREFVGSERYHPFSMDAFRNVVANIVEEDADVRLSNR